MANQDNVYDMANEAGAYDDHFDYTELEEDFSKRQRVRAPIFETPISDGKGIESLVVYEMESGQRVFRGKILDPRADENDVVNMFGDPGKSQKFYVRALGPKGEEVAHVTFPTKAASATKGHGAPGDSSAVIIELMMKNQEEQRRMFQEMMEREQVRAGQQQMYYEQQARARQEEAMRMAEVERQRRRDELTEAEERHRMRMMEERQRIADQFELDRMRMEGRIREIEAHGGSSNNMVSQMLPVLIAAMQGGNDKTSELLQTLLPPLLNRNPQNGIMEALSVVEAAKRIGSDREPSFLETLAGVAEPALNAFASVTSAKGGTPGAITADQVVNAARQQPGLIKQLIAATQKDPVLMQAVMGGGEDAEPQHEIQFGEALG